MARLLFNLLSATLDADIDDTDTTVTFTGPLKEFGSTNIATIAGPDTLTLKAGYELMHVTAYTSGASTATVTRGVEGSTATAHNEGDVLRHVSTADDLPSLSGYALLAGATFSGDVSVPDEAYDATAWNGNLEVPTKNAVRDKIETIGSGTVSDTAYGVGWDGDTTTAPSKNAVYDKIETLGAGSVSDTAYAGSWDGVTATAPSKNAVYDKIESLSGTYAPVAGSVGGPPVIVRKTADESVTSSTALQDDDALFKAMAANEVWFVEMFLHVEGAQSPGDFDPAINLPALATMRWAATGLASGATAAEFSMKTNSSTTVNAASAGTFGTIGAGTPVMVKIEATVINGANAGNIQLRWAQGGSSGTPTKVLAGSILKATRLA